MKGFKNLFVAIVTVAVVVAGSPLFAGGQGEDETMFIPVVSKGLQHQFWQTVRAGAEDAATEYGVDITFEGPAS
ncbi:MAG: LacI family transcriptional regulator, partial [Spirochaetales bacterium]|nr:LacI family transcriptional regulator [Spirochaetales bacterium]